MFANPTRKDRTSIAGSLPATDVFIFFHAYKKLKGNNRGDTKQKQNRKNMYKLVNKNYTMGTYVSDNPMYFCEKKHIGFWTKLFKDPLVCEVALSPESVVRKGDRLLKTNHYSVFNPVPIREFFARQTEDTLLDYVDDDGLCLEYIDEKAQTPDICLYAVRQNGRALQYVKNPTPLMEHEAVRQTGRAVAFVREQTRDLCVAAVKQNGLWLKYVRHPDKTVIMMAVHNNPMALKYVKEAEQTPFLCKMAVTTNGLAIRHVIKKTPELCAAAIQQNPHAKLYCRPSMGNANAKAVTFSDIRTTNIFHPFRDFDHPL
jgi:hypothetical protein